METNNAATQKYWQVRERLMVARDLQRAFFAALDQLDDALGSTGVVSDANRDLADLDVETLLEEVRRTQRKPSFASVVEYVRTLVPSGGRAYDLDRQTVAEQVLNHFPALTTSDPDFVFISAAIRDVEVWK